MHERPGFPPHPFATFLAAHFEVGGDSKSLKYQEAFWPSAIDFVDLAHEYNAHLTLQFNPQWPEYVLKDQRKLNMLRGWQRHGHEVGLQHHGYDHGDWNGYTNRPEKEDDSRFRGNVRDMMKLMRQFVHPYQISSGTITDEEFDFPQGIKYDTEGIQIYHARSEPKRVTLGGNNKVIQVGMGFLSCEGDVGSFKEEYRKSKGNEIFGVVTHEKDFVKNPTIIEEWLDFVRSRGKTIKTVKDIITMYQKVYPVRYNDKPMNYLSDVMGTIIPSDIEGKGSA
ncbi:MAG: hypothetical protein JSV09_14325 [Thermoplasmata archaeon]|nr:MAG: hypothetical protein JSV09_14325 [Thermoplasmata archaeon]